MNIPNDREFAQLMREEHQRRIESGGQRFFLFGRAFLIFFLVVGMLALAYVAYALCFGGLVGSTLSGKLYVIVFLVLWNLCVLAMIRQTSTKHRAAKEAEAELAKIAQQFSAGDSSTREAWLSEPPEK